MALIRLTYLCNAHVLHVLLMQGEIWVCRGFNRPTNFISRRSDSLRVTNTDGGSTDDPALLRIRVPLFRVLIN